MKYRYYTCDVFTRSRFGGNPLAVLPEADGLSTDQMQNIAREFNYSETTFVLPPEQGQTRRVRIFTPAKEVPFAGHPNIGTAFTLAAIGDVELDSTVTFEEGAGLVPVEIRRREQGIWCELQAPQTVQIGGSLDVDLAAQSLSLDPMEIVTANHPPQESSVGLPFLMIELRDQETLARARANLDALRAISDSGISPDVHAYVTGSHPNDLRVRMFAPLDGVPEDPATGSANGALVAMLTQIRSLDDGDHHWQIEQGLEMGRPSQLFARTRKQQGEVTGTWIGGNCVMVCEGTIECD